jgi:signal transduction protein with GAF and PtsI domain
VSAPGLGTGTLHLEYTASLTIGKIRLRLNEGLTGWVARERHLLAISRDTYKDPALSTSRSAGRHMRSSFGPVIARNRVVGVINVQHGTHHTR